MTQQEFQNYTGRFVQDEVEMLGVKGNEYAAGDADRLEAFKVIAAQCGISPEKVCLVFLLKHITSICKYVKGASKPTTESFNERIHDARNYLLFLAMLREENN